MGYVRSAAAGIGKNIEKSHLWLPSYFFILFPMAKKILPWGDLSLSNTTFERVWFKWYIQMYLIQPYMTEIFVCSYQCKPCTKTYHLAKNWAGTRAELEDTAFSLFFWNSVYQTDGWRGFATRPHICFWADSNSPHKVSFPKILK